MFNKLDKYYARLLFTIDGFFDYVKERDQGKCRMSEESVDELIHKLFSEPYFLPELRTCYEQTGFLVFVTHTKAIVYTKNDSYLNLRDEGPSSEDVYDTFV